MRKYTVATLSDELDQLLQGRYPTVLVEGEIGQLQTPASGHCYLQLRDRGGARDADCVLAAVMWRNEWHRSRYRPKVGDRVSCRGRLGVYGARGAYQLYVTEIEPAGLGDLARQIAERKARLEADGLLDPRRKRPLPKFPRVVGVATSRTGAALQDFLAVSRRRWPAARILVANCLVQGDEAPASVAMALELLVEDGRAELAVVTRGGGSKEDLLAFQDEGLARAIAHCPIPVVSAVGHQIDTTLADLVADAVAPTPSAAAMLVFPDGPALAQRVDELAGGLVAAWRRDVARRRERIAALRARLRHPGERLALGRRRLVDLDGRLTRAMARRQEEATARLGRAEDRLLPAMRARIVDRRRRLEAVEGRLRALSPLAVLGRGYAIVEGPAGLVRDPADVAPGDALSVRVAAGAFQARVEASPQEQPVAAPTPEPTA